MCDARRPVAHCGEELRRIVAARQRSRRRLAVAALTVCAAVPLAASALWRAPVLLVWNASPSAPMGLYQVHREHPIRVGDMVIAWTPEPARTLAGSRHYLPVNVPLVKRVAALAGDRVCAAGGEIFINGRRVAVRQQSDRAGRPMPTWSGCRELRAGQYFLLMDNYLSFDGRYFGVTSERDIVGRAEALWTR